MNTHPRNPVAGTEGVQPGEASGKHQGLHQPADDQRVEESLDEVGLDDMGASFEDQIRDRRGSGVAPTADVRSDGNDDERNERR